MPASSGPFPLEGPLEISQTGEVLIASAGEPSAKQPSPSASMLPPAPTTLPARSKSPAWLDYGTPPNAGVFCAPPQHRVYEPEPAALASNRPPDPLEPPHLADFPPPPNSQMFTVNGVSYEVYFPDHLDKDLDNQAYKTVKSQEHQLGWAYQTIVNTSKAAARRSKLTSVGMPEQYKARLNKHGEWTLDPVEGQYKSPRWSAICPSGQTKP